MERDREKDSCNVCRTCKGESAPFQDLWEKFEGTVVVANMLMLCASVQVSKTKSATFLDSLRAYDNISKYIMTTLHLFYNRQ